MYGQSLIVSLIAHFHTLFVSYFCKWKEFHLPIANLVSLQPIQNHQDWNPSLKLETHLYLGLELMPDSLPPIHISLVHCPRRVLQWQACSIYCCRKLKKVDNLKKKLIISVFGHKATLKWLLFSWNENTGILKYT